MTLRHFRRLPQPGGLFLVALRARLKGQPPNH